MVPDERGMIQRLEQDGELGKALDLVKKAAAKAEGEEARILLIDEMRLTRKTVDPSDSEKVTGLLNRALETYVQLETKESVLAELVAIIRIQKDSEATWGSLKNHSSLSHFSHRAEVYRALVDLSLSENRPVMAARIQQQMLMGGSLGIEDYYRGAQLWYSASRLTDSLKLLVQLPGINTP